MTSEHGSCLPPQASHTTGFGWPPIFLDEYANRPQKIMYAKDPPNITVWNGNSITLERIAASNNYT